MQPESANGEPQRCTTSCPSAIGHVQGRANFRREVVLPNFAVTTASLLPAPLMPGFCFWGRMPWSKRLSRGAMDRDQNPFALSSPLKPIIAGRMRRSKPLPCCRGGPALQGSFTLHEMAAEHHHASTSGRRTEHSSGSLAHPRSPSASCRKLFETVKFAHLSRQSPLWPALMLRAAPPHTCGHVSRANCGG